MNLQGRLRKRVKEIIKKKGISVDELSESMGYSKGYIANILRGQNNLSFATLDSICEKLNLAIFIAIGDKVKQENEV